MILCEVCGKPATSYHQDLVEIEPMVDENGKRWAQHESVGEHYTCENHAKPWEEVLKEIPPFGRLFVRNQLVRLGVLKR